MNICVVDNLFGEHKYGEIQDNKLNIKHVRFIRINRYGQYNYNIL